MNHLTPYIEAHHEAVYRKRCDGRLHDIRASWWALLEAYHEYEPRSNLMASLALIGIGALFGVVGMGIYVGVFVK